MTKRLMREEKAPGQSPRFEPVSVLRSLNLLAETDLNLTHVGIEPSQPKENEAFYPSSQLVPKPGHFEAPRGPGISPLPVQLARLEMD
jgi:hypothetical protein